MKISLGMISVGGSSNVATKCPHCGHDGTFELLEDAEDITAYNVSPMGSKAEFYLGIRKCPNTRCRGHLFFIMNAYDQIVFTSPTVSIPFNKDNIPSNVLKAFEEAVKCHACDCFIASAIMIRKTLEELCLDRGANGDNLFKRLEILKNKIVLPDELLIAMNELRLVGNDAAHLVARTYDEIGKEEIEISIELTKEILKAVYQYESLLQKMRNLKRKNSTTE
ncbi:MAG: hypothetical protein JWP57_846 [Spirosoma sp.]|nr:hypothetical protein [Spirosoma sp.]